MTGFYQLNQSIQLRLLNGKMEKKFKMDKQFHLQQLMILKGILKVVMQKIMQNLQVRQ